MKCTSTRQQLKIKISLNYILCFYFHICKRIICILLGSTESSATKVKNDTSNLSLSAKLRSKTITSCETPKFRGVKKLRKRASSLTDMIDHHLIDTNCSLPEFDSGFVNSCKQAQSSDDYCFIASPISS